MDLNLGDLGGITCNRPNLGWIPVHHVLNFSFSLSTKIEEMMSILGWVGVLIRLIIILNRILV